MSSDNKPSNHQSDAGKKTIAQQNANLLWRMQTEFYDGTLISINNFIAELKQLIQVDQHNNLAFSLLADCYIHQNSYILAIAILNQALHFNANEDLRHKRNYCRTMLNNANSNELRCLTHIAKTIRSL